MFSINLVAHAVAAVALAWLMYEVVRLRKDLVWLRELLGEADSARVRVDWPSKFLGRLCRVFGIEFVVDSKFAREEKPIRIDERVWARWLVGRRVREVALEDDGGKPVVRIRVSSGSESGSGVPAELTKALGGKLAINLEENA